MPNVFLILGCGGNGITFSMLAIELILKWLAKERDPLMQILSPQRG